LKAIASRGLTPYGDIEKQGRLLIKKERSGEYGTV
jgi:hypothetical protein